MNETETDVVIVRARCAGAATATLLARRDINVVVVDRATQLGDTASMHAIARGGVVSLVPAKVIKHAAGVGFLVGPRRRLFHLFRQHPVGRLRLLHYRSRLHRRLPYQPRGDVRVGRRERLGQRGYSRRAQPETVAMHQYAIEREVRLRPISPEPSPVGPDPKRSWVQTDLNQLLDVEAEHLASAPMPPASIATARDPSTTPHSIDANLEETASEQHWRPPIRPNRDRRAPPFATATPLRRSQAAPGTTAKLDQVS
jgi:hypothetical protein